MHWLSPSLLACLVAVTVAQSSELTLKEKLEHKVPPDTVVLPPGVGLCMKGLPRDQCSIRFGGGRSLAETTRKNIVKKLEKRGWVRTKKLPRQINAVHICCHRKKFGMELKPIDPKDEIPLKRIPKKLKEDTEKTWKGVDEGNDETKKEKYERTQTSETEKKDGGVKETHKANTTAPQEKEKPKPKIKHDERKEKAREAGKSKKYLNRKKKEKEVERGRNMTGGNKWKTQTNKDEKPFKESGGKFGENKAVKQEKQTDKEHKPDKVIKPEKETGKEKDKPPKIPSWMTKDLDKKLPDQYLEGEELVDETDLW